MVVKRLQQIGFLIAGALAIATSSARGAPANGGAAFANARAGFPAMTVTFTKALISDDGFLIANYAKTYGIRTIFLTVSGQDVTDLADGNRATVNNLEALFATCNVYIVTGDDTWLANPHRAPSDAQTIARVIAPMYPQFAGILYDIEPQKYPTWQSDRQGTIDRYFALLDTLLTGRKRLTYKQTFVTTIGEFARQPNRSGGKSPTMLEAVQQYPAIDGTYFLMAGNSAASQYSRAQHVFGQISKPFWAVANTAPDAGSNGYSGSTADYLTHNMLALASALEKSPGHLAGVDVSSWDSDYVDLPSILPQPTPQPAPQPTGPLVPPAGTDYIGAYVAPNKTKEGPTTIAAFEQAIGRKLAYDIHYYHWTTQFPNNGENDDVNNGRIPLISWRCGDSNARVAEGHDDALIKARADAVRAFGHPVFLRYEWEMNLSARTEARKPCYDRSTDLHDGFFSPAKYIAAWKRMHAIFKAERADNVVWLWNPGAGGPDPAQYYPGKDQVDWVGLDCYDRHDDTFENTFVPYLDDLSQFDKPMMIVETGALASYQGAFFKTAEETLKYRYPHVRAFSYLDAESKVNWSLDARGIAGFRALANTHLMSARQP